MGNYFKCKVDPDADNFVEKLKSLHPGFQEDFGLVNVSPESFLKYVVLTYDIESPFVIKYKDWAQRRQMTARECNFPRIGDKYIAEVENIILGYNPIANKIILTYLFLLNDLVFSQYQSYQALYYRQIKASLEQNYDNPGHYEKLKKNISDLAKELKSLETAVFHGDETRELRRALYDYASKLSLDFRPEQIARRKEENEPEVDHSPYPKDYKPEDLSFVDDK